MSSLINPHYHGFHICKITRLFRFIANCQTNDNFWCFGRFLQIWAKLWKISCQIDTSPTQGKQSSHTVNWHPFYRLSSATFLFCFFAFLCFLLVMSLSIFNAILYSMGYHSSLARDWTCPLHWEPGVSTTRTPGKSHRCLNQDPQALLLKWFYCFSKHKKAVVCLLEKMCWISFI